MLTQQIRQHNLIPFIKGMSPERRIPSIIQIFNSLIFLLQPDTKCLFTIFTITLTAKFIRNMPCHNIIVIFISLCDFCCQTNRIFFISRTVGAGIMSAPKFSFHTVKFCSQNIRIFLCHPCRMCSG